MTETALQLSRGFFRFLLAIALSAVAGGADGLRAAAPVSEAPGRGVAMQPNGAVPDAGWALARLNDGSCFEKASFAYPETTQPVRLYLIDSAVAHLGTWFAQNPRLTVDHVEHIGGEGTAVNHGTRMLSLIAGPETGAALGSPIHLVSLNIYPGGENGGTTSGLMADAVWRAIELHEDQPEPRKPGVICLASSSWEPGENSYILEHVIDQAVAAGLTVVVSAGNHGGDAGDYIPAGYGTKDGVVCVGASDANNRHLAGTNSGAAVDLYAPGFEVRTVSLPTPEPGAFYPMSGTSPAAALTAAAAVIELSKQPDLTPQQVEAALTTGALATVSAPEAPAAALVQVQPDPEGDSDRDGAPDIIESFFGSNPADPAVVPDPPTVAKAGGQARLSFPVAADLFAGGHELTDGSTWKVWCSADLKAWTEATGTIEAGPAAAGKIPVTFTVATAEPSCFLRVEVLPPR